MVQGFIVRCMCLSDLSPGLDLIFTVELVFGCPFLKDYKWEVIDIFYGGCSWVVNDSLPYGMTLNLFSWLSGHDKFFVLDCYTAGWRLFVY